MEEFNLENVIKHVLESFVSEDQQGCMTKEYKQVRNAVDEDMEKLERTLDESQKDILCDIEDGYGQALAISEPYMFEKGFRMGAKLVFELLKK